QELNNTGTVTALQGLEVNAKRLENAGTLLAHQGLTATASVLTNKGTFESTAGLMKLVAHHALNNHRDIRSQNHLEINTPQLINQGSIIAPYFSHLREPVVDNQGTIEVEHDLKLTTQSLKNSGKIIIKQGSLDLSAKGLIENSELIISNRALTIYTNQEVNNRGKIESQNYLSLTANSFINTGFIQNASGNLHLKINQLLDNQANHIISKGNLTIGAHQLNNTGELGAKGHLNLILGGHMNNDGQLAAYQTTINTSGSLTNTKEINSETHVNITASELVNSGTIAANQKLDITLRGPLNNTGILKNGSYAATLKVDGLFKNAGQIHSGGQLTIQKAYTSNPRVENNGELRAHNLDIDAYSLINPGKLIGVGSNQLQVEQSLSNTQKIGSQGLLYIKAGGLLENTNAAQIVTAGKLAIHAYQLKNQGTIHAGTAGATLGVTRELDNSATIKGAESFTITANKINNTGTIATSTFLTLEAPNMYNTGNLSTQSGNLTLDASSSLTNHCPIVSGRDLIIYAPIVENHTKLIGKNSLQIHVDALINKGELKAGLGDSYIQVSGEITNVQMIAVRGKLTLQADQINNQQTIVAQKELSITTSNLNNEAVIQGSGNSRLTIHQKLSNTKNIASTQDLTIQANELEHTGLIESNQNLNLNLDKLNGSGVIQGGKGTTQLAVKEAIHHTSELSSQGRLGISTNQNLDNQGKIIAGEDLKIKATSIKNNSGGYIVGKQGTTDIQAIDGKIDNHSFINGGEFLKLQAREELNNAGMIQAKGNIDIAALSVSNEKTIASEQDMTIAGENYIYNLRGNIFAQGNIILQGKNGQHTKEIKNETFSDQEAKIEAVGYTIIKAHYLENLGKDGKYSWSKDTTYNLKEKYGKYASKNWTIIQTTYDKYWFNSSKRHGNTDIPFYLIEKNVVSGSMQSNPAHIYTEGNLYIDVINKVHNYGGNIIAKENIHVGNQKFTDTVPSNQHIQGGPYINNETPSRQITIDDAYIYKKEWRNLAFDLYRVYRQPKTFTIESTQKATIRAGQGLKIDAKGLENGISPTAVNVAEQVDPLKDLTESATIDTSNYIQLPDSPFSPFKLNLPGSNHTHYQSSSTYHTPSLLNQSGIYIDTDLNIAEGRIHTNLDDFQTDIGQSVRGYNQPGG
ncbi:MAG: hypothetical protein ACK4M7_01820, partial [Burkholderiales bacterium]